MKKCLFALFCACCALCISAQSILAQGTVYRWSFCKTKDHTPPPCAKELTVIERYPAFYLNPIAKDDKVIYLTFDAGYENGNVAKILDTLKAHQVQGAFFLLEHVVKNNTPLVKRMLDEGHLICNHTAKHKNMSVISNKDEFCAELMRMEDCYREIIGAELSKFYRPPEGTFSESNLEHASSMGYITVFWSFAYADWDNKRQPNPDVALQNLLDHLHPGEILLLHPTSATNATILDAFLTQAKAQGYRFGSLEELCHVSGHSSPS